MTKTEKQAIDLAIIIAKTAVSDLVHDGSKIRALTVKHTIERLGSIQSLLQSVQL